MCSSTNFDKNRVIMRKKPIDISSEFRYPKNDGEPGQKCRSSRGKMERGMDMSWDLRSLGGAVQLPCGELAWTKPQIFWVLAGVEAMRGIVLSGDVLYGNGAYTGSSWQYCLTGEDHYAAFLRENCRDSCRTAEAFIRDFLACHSGEYLFAPVLREGVDAYIHRSTGGLAPGYDGAAQLHHGVI